MSQKPHAISSEEIDEDWHKERRVEILRFLAEVERRTLLTNLIATLIIAVVSQWLPNASDFHLPTVLRLIAIGLTALVYRAIRSKLGRGESVVPLYLACIAIGVLAGISWALLVAPVFTDPVLHPAAFIVSGGVLIAISLVSSSTASLPQIWAPFGVAFLATFWLRMTDAPEEFALPISIGFALIYFAVAVFSIGAAHQRRVAASTLVENRRLSEELVEALAHAEFLAYRDPLTGLYNRRGLFDHVRDELEDGVTHQTVLIDIDNYKQVNDQFGHDTGDRLLIGIAQALRDYLRSLPGEGHATSRLGGDEFAAILVVSDDQQADAMAEEIRARIEQTAREFSMPATIATASIGISTATAGDELGKSLSKADAALYEAKAAGRNTVRRAKG